MSWDIWEGFRSNKRGDTYHQDGTLIFAWVREVWQAIIHGYGINKTNFGYKVRYQLVEKKELIDNKLWSKVGLKLGKKIYGHSIFHVINQAKDTLTGNRKIFLLKLNNLEVIVGVYLDDINCIYVYYSPITRQVVQSDFIAFEQEVLKCIREECQNDINIVLGARSSWSAVEIILINNKKSESDKLKNNTIDLEDMH